MRQIARRLRDGRLELIEVPEPAPTPGTVSVRLEASVLSSGTKRATLEVGRKGLLGKARARPDQVRQVVERARREGVRSTVALVRQRLEQLAAASSQREPVPSPDSFFLSTLTTLAAALA